MRRLLPGKLKLVSAEFTHMLELGIILLSNSPWSSPLQMVPKKSGDGRPCSDYQEPNKIAAFERYLIPHMQDLTAYFTGKMVLSISILIVPTTRYLSRKLT